MDLTSSKQAQTIGADCTEAFRAAYNNRYTWDSKFSGYGGDCKWSNGDQNISGSFILNSDLKPQVNGIKDENVNKLISSQLWEVAIHRVRRSFEKTHGENTFTAGSVNDTGLEVIVGGKSQGDKYRIKNNIVTMVHRHIHGNLITIFTNDVQDTGDGYLSNSYTSQYSDPKTGMTIESKNYFTDKFIQLQEVGYWVLSNRSIEKKGHDELTLSKEMFSFENLYPIHH